MKRLSGSLAASACLVALLGVADPAQAAFATFVSGAGLDTNDCLTPATPCRDIGTPTGALSKTDAGGIIHVLPGEYNAFFINKSVEIVADAGQASVYTTAAGPIPGVTGAAGIAVDVGAADVVRIRGFLVNVDHGIVIINSGVVHIEDCTLLAVSNRYGLLYAPSGASELYVSGSVISRLSGATGGGGILIKPTGSGTAEAVLDNVAVEDNATGILIDGRATTGSNTVTIRNSAISGSQAFGLHAVDSGGGTTNVMVEGSTSSNNGTQGFVATGANAQIRLRDSTSTGNGRGLQVASSGEIISHGGNVVANNTVNGGFTSTVPQQ
jgi:hypothetical protein